MTADRGSDLSPPEQSARPGSDPAQVACLVLAHADVAQVLRLRAALAPMPVLLHCDARTEPDVFDAMTDGIDPAFVITPRLACGWASFALVRAELEAYRRALAVTRADHFVVLSGADYPLRPATELAAAIGAAGDRSIAELWPLPFPAWGRSGGLSRLRYRHWVWRKRMVRLPLPRRIPADVAPSGGSQWKIISRRHAAAVLAVTDARPDLVAFWERSWCADETFVPTLLRSPITGIDWDAESVDGSAWWIGWDGTRRKSPPTLDESHLGAITAAAHGDGRRVPALFARKMSTGQSTGLMDRIDAELRHTGVPSARPAADAGSRS